MRKSNSSKFFSENLNKTIIDNIATLNKYTNTNLNNNSMKNSILEESSFINNFLSKFNNLSEFLIKNDTIIQVISLSYYDNGRLFAILTDCSKSKNIYVYDYNTFKTKFSIENTTKNLLYCNHYDKGDTLISLNGWQLIYYKISICKIIKKVCLKNILGTSESNKEPKLFKIMEFRINHINPDKKTITQSYLNTAIIQRQNFIFFINIETITSMYIIKLDCIPIHYDILSSEFIVENIQNTDKLEKVKSNKIKCKNKSKMSFIDKYFNEDEDFTKCIDTYDGYDSLNQTNSTFIKEKTDDIDLNDDLVSIIYLSKYQRKNKTLWKKLICKIPLINSKMEKTEGF